MSPDVSRHTRWAHLGRAKTTPDLRASSLSQAASLKMSVKVLSVIVIRSVTPVVVVLENLIVHVHNYFFDVTLSVVNAVRRRSV